MALSTHSVQSFPKVWEQGQVCPVCPLFRPLTSLYANPCAPDAEPPQHDNALGDRGERGRLSLVHKLPVTF